jgi:hypothetical protein
MRLFDLWQAWFQGEQVQAAQLWGWTVLRWGRLGKAMEFVAGLVVVIDLLDPDKLRRRGAAARERLRQRKSQAQAARRMFDIEIMNDKVFASIIIVDVGEDAIIRVINRARRPNFGPKAPFTVEEYEAFRADTLSGLAGAHQCQHDHGKYEVCSEQANYVGERVDEFLCGRWSADDRRLLQQARVKRARGFLLAFAVMIGTIVGPLIVDPHSSNTWPFSLAMLLVALAMTPPGWRLGAPWIWLGAQPAIVGGTVLAGLLDKARPLHLLRRVALALFVIGFHFDLLAS